MPPPPKPATSPAAYRPGQRLAVGAQDPRVEVGLQPAERLAGEDVQPHRDQRAGLGVEEPVRGRDPDQPVAAVARGRRGSPSTCRSLVNALSISRSRATIGALDVVEVSSGCVGERVHARRPARAGRRRTTKSSPCCLNASTGAGAPGRTRPSTCRTSLAGEVGVLLRAGERELLLDDLLGQHEPGVVVPGGAGCARACRGCRSRGTAAPGSRRPVASSHSDDGPGRIRMPCPGQIGSQLRDALGVVPHPVRG